MKCLLLLPVFLFAAHAAAKPMIPTPPDTPVLGELEPVLDEVLLKGSDKDGSLATVIDHPKIQAQIAKHKLVLFGGPVIGDVTADSVKIWLRTAGEAEVEIEIDGRRTPAVKTPAAADFTAVIPVGGLKPFTEYAYRVLVNGEPVPGEKPAFRTAPEKGQEVSFEIAFGGGARYNHPKERIWDTVAQRKPLAFLFLGDNLYQDKPLDRALQRVYYYRRQLRPEYRRLTSGCAAYAIWDDHDFGDNDCAGGLDPFLPAWKVPVWKVFKENWPNPYFGGGPEQPGCWFDFSLGDVDFFMTDGRYYRDFKQGTMLGPAQKTWLLEKLAASKATFKVIASGTLWTETADKGGKDSWWGVKGEREAIFSLIDEQGIGGVVLLSADRHRTDVYEIKRPNGYTLYEFETSKLTNNHTHPTRKQAVFSYNKGNFYGAIQFDFTKADPELTFRCITIDGETVYTLTLPRSRLQK